jgi:protein-disulfide isomerase
MQGNSDARWTLVEYYECPYFGEAHPIVKRLQERLGDKLLFVFRNFPLREIHPHGEHAAETAEFAAANGNLWEMHDLLHENQNNLEDEAFSGSRMTWVSPRINFVSLSWQRRTGPA